MWSKRLEMRPRYAICLGVRNTRSKFNVPLQIESQGFCVVRQPVRVSSLAGPGVSGEDRGR